MSETPFHSPLAVPAPSRWTQIEFRQPLADARIEALASEMEAQIWRLADLVPPALAPRARQILQGYPGPGRRFIDLFHRPVWSVLAWLESRPAARAAAVRAQALALFLHLWDDHLCDGQLRPDIVTLHMRSLAWRDMEEALSPQGVAPPGLETYLAALQGRRPADSLDRHLAQFVAEIAIWRIAPRVLAAPCGAPLADRVDEALREFCLAWRLVDDVQDLEDDRMAGQDNSVRLVMDAAAGARWDALRGAPLGAVPPEAERDCAGAVEIVLERARAAMARAASAARLAGLPEWAGEIVAMQGF